MPRRASGSTSVPPSGIGPFGSRLDPCIGNDAPEPNERGAFAVSDQATSGDPIAAFGPNEWLVDELYQQFLTDKTSVDKAWWGFFEDYRPGEADTNAAPSRTTATATNTATTATSTKPQTTTVPTNGSPNAPTNGSAAQAAAKAAPAAAKAAPAAAPAAAAPAAAAAAAKTSVAKTDAKSEPKTEP